MTEIALQAVELVRRIEGTVTHTLVNGVDLAVNKGEFVAITGPSGSGKSSLLYLLGLLDAPTEGEVIICGQATSKLSESDRADVRLTKCGFVFQFHFLPRALCPNPTCASAALPCSARSDLKSTRTSVPASSPADSASASPLRVRFP